MIKTATTPPQPLNQYKASLNTSVLADYKFYKIYWLKQNISGNFKGTIHHFPLNTFSTSISNSPKNMLAFEVLQTANFTCTQILNTNLLKRNITINTYTNGENEEVKV